MYANENRVMKEGETAKELNYQGEDMQAAVLRKTDRHQTDYVREITYLFEYENIRLFLIGRGIFIEKCKRLKFNEKERRIV